MKEYIYNRYNGVITTYKKLNNNVYMCLETGLTIDLDLELMLGKTSENIIDLIESGDYVNGKYVQEVKEYKYGKSILAFIGVVDNEDIKSIVTKEMFLNAEYRVETN